MSKVYCKECRWYKPRFATVVGTVAKARCYSSGNAEWAEDYEERYERWVMHPKDRNAKNNCPLFERKVSMWRRIIKG